MQCSERPDGILPCFDGGEVRAVYGEGSDREALSSVSVCRFCSAASSKVSFSVFSCCSVSVVARGKAPGGKCSVARWVSVRQRSVTAPPVMVSVSTAWKEVLLKEKAARAGRSVTHTPSPHPLASVSDFCCSKFAPCSSTVCSAGTTPHPASPAPRASSASEPSCAVPAPSVISVSFGSLLKRRFACRKLLYSAEKVVRAGRLPTLKASALAKLLPPSVIFCREGRSRVEERRRRNWRG